MSKNDYKLWTGENVEATSTTMEQMKKVLKAMSQVPKLADCSPHLVKNEDGYVYVQFEEADGTPRAMMSVETYQNLCKDFSLPSAETLDDGQGEKNE